MWEVCVGKCSKLKVKNEETTGKKEDPPLGGDGNKGQCPEDRGSQQALLCASCIESLLLLNNLKISLISITSNNNIVSGFHKD